MEVDLHSKNRRQIALCQMIDSHDFLRQSQVVSAMQRMGFDVNQSSISRDFQELGIGKVSGIYRSAESLRNRSFLQQLIRSTDTAGNHLVIIKTSAGGAAAVAEAIDIESVDGVAGTVAGDNTIFVATKTKTAQRNVLKMVQSL